MAAKRSRGRQPLPKGEALDRQITCRVRATEEAEMKAAAEAKGLSLAAWMRQVLKGAARRASSRSSKKKTRRRKS